MCIQTKPFTNQFSWIIPTLSVCFFVACSNRTSEVGYKASVTEVDSISAWIEAGRNNNSSEAIRVSNSVKAYEEANSIKVDSIKLKYLSKIQWNFLAVQDSTWFRKTNKEANILAQKVGDSIRMGFTHWDLAEFLGRNKINDSAYYHFSTAQKLFDILGDDLRVGRLTYEMALTQMKVKDYTGSEINIIEAIELLKPLKENLWLYRCYNLLGIIAKDIKEYEKSLEYYGMASTYLEKSKAGNQFEPEIENNIGATYQEMGAHQKAASFFKKALGHDSLYFKNPGYYAGTLNNLAKSKHKIDPVFNTENLFKSALKIRDSIGDIAGLAGGHYDLAEYYLEKRDSVKALDNAKKAKAYAKESSNNERLLQSLELLTKLDPENAAIYGQNYMALNDSLQQEERKLRNKFARIRFETDEVVAENQSLAREKQLWVGIAVAILLLGTAGYVIIDQRLKNQKLRFQQHQQASNEKIFDLMLSEKQKFEEGKKLEQKRISEELHDGVLGKMLGARMVLTGLNKKADQEAIAERAEAISALKDVEVEVRTISHELSHSAYREIHNFIRSIRDLSSTVCDAANINHTFDHDQTIDWDNLNVAIRINLYRIVQESLQNAVKHSKCNNIVLDFSTAENALQILIRDDGKGFDFNKRKRGIGMRNIRSRIKKMNGSWRIDSKPGAGTSVRLSIPIEYYVQESQIIDDLKQVEKV